MVQRLLEFLSGRILGHFASHLKNQHKSQDHAILPGAQKKDKQKHLVNGTSDTTAQESRHHAAVGAFEPRSGTSTVTGRAGRARSRAAGPAVLGPALQPGFQELTGSCSVSQETPGSSCQR